MSGKKSSDELVNSLRMELERALKNNKEKRDQVCGGSFFVYFLF